MGLPLIAPYVVHQLTMGCRTRLSMGMVLSAWVAVSGCGSESSSFEPEPGYFEAEGQETEGKADGTGRDWPSAGTLPEDCQSTRPLQVLFTPDEPAVTLELTLIDKVRQAAKASAKTYPEGQNPYRIRYAVYNLTHEEIARRLVQAEADGVDVQVLIESDQLEDAWVRTDDIFREAGLEVELNHHKLTQAQSRSCDLVGIEDSGLMHLKTRIFEMPGWSAVLSGSFNPNQTAGANEENLQLIQDPALVSRYIQAHTSVLQAQPIANTWDDGAPLNVLFSPAGQGPRASSYMLQWLAQEPEQILLMVFSLRNVTSPTLSDSLVDILRQKVASGVPVYVITDRKQSDGIDLDGKSTMPDDPTEDTLRAAGVHVFEAINDASRFFDGPNPYAAMHHKVAVLGRKHLRVITDAANWTAAALGSRKYAEKNVESMLFIDSERLDQNATGRRYLAQWFRVLDRYAGQSQWQDGEWSAEQVMGALMQGPDWPQQGVFFQGTVRTHFGEQVVVSGGPDALGRWGQSGPGLGLMTNEKVYPQWVSPVAVPLPLGSRLEWKLTVQSTSGVRWEGGDNRQGRVMPEPCSAASDTMKLSGTWR